MLIATHHLLIPMNPFLTIHPFRIRTNSFSPNNISPQTSSNTNPSSTTNLPFQSIPQTPSTNHSRDRTRHQSQNQSPSPSITNNRDTKTHYNLRQQPKMDYRIFIPPTKL